MQAFPDVRAAGAGSDLNGGIGLALKLGVDCEVYVE